MKAGRLDRNQKSSLLEEGGSINPMDGMTNLPDVMLVLAVGIMLALVAHWNIDVALTTPGATDASVEDMQEIENAEEISNVKVSDETEDVESNSLSEYGTVYLDQDGNYYVEPKNKGEDD